MKTIVENINSALAMKLRKNNKEYLFWLDGTKITARKIASDFSLTKYDNGSVNLEHKIEDFKIENIVF